MANWGPRHKLTCDLLRWDVRMHACLEDLRSKYHADGLLDPIAMDALNWLDNFISDELSGRNFNEAMNAFRVYQSRAMNGSGKQDFVLSAIMNDLMSHTFPNGQPQFYARPPEFWGEYRMVCQTPDDFLHEISFYCQDKRDCFDQLLNACLRIPEGDPTQCWAVKSLMIGSISLTHEFYRWAEPMLPQFMLDFWKHERNRKWVDVCLPQDWRPASFEPEGRVTI